MTKALFKKHYTITPSFDNKDNKRKHYKGYNGYNGYYNNKIIMFIFVIICLVFNGAVIFPSIHAQTILPHSHAPLTVELSNVNQPYPTITLRFSLNENSLGLDYGQYIAVEFPNQHHLSLNSLLNNSPSYTCSLTSIIDNKPYMITADPATKSPIYKKSQVETNIAYCKLQDLNKNLEKNTLVTLKIQFLNNFSLFKTNLLPSVKLFTSTSNTPTKMILDSNYNFSEIGLYKDLGSSSINNAVSLTNFQPVNCQNSISPGINTACGTIYPYETFDMELIGKFNQSIEGINEKYNIIVIFPTKTYGTGGIENTAEVNIENLVFSSENVLDTQGNLLYPKFNFGRLNKMEYLGEKEAYVFMDIETSSVSAGRRFRILFKNAMGIKVGGIRVEIHMIYKNSYSTVGYSSSNYINTSVIPITPSSNSFASVFNSENNDVFAPGGYHTIFSFEFQSEILTENLFIKIQHVNHSETENYINLISSTCDFSLNPDISQSFGERPICHPINNTLNPDVIKPNKRSGVVFKLSSLSGIQKIEKNKTFFLKVFVLYEICGRSTSPYINVMDGVVSNTKTTNIPYVKPEFSIEAYERLDFGDSSEVLLSGLLAQTSSNMVFHNKCYQTYHPEEISDEDSLWLYVAQTDPLLRDESLIINPLISKEFTDFRLANLDSTTNSSNYLDLPPTINDVSPSSMEVGYLFHSDPLKSLTRTPATVPAAPLFYLAAYLKHNETPSPYHFARMFAGPFVDYPVVDTGFSKFVKGKLRVQFTNEYFKYSDSSKLNNCKFSWYSNSILSQSASAVAAQRLDVTDPETNLLNYIVNNQNPETRDSKIHNFECQLKNYNEFSIDPEKIFETYDTSQRNIYLESSYNDVDYSNLGTYIGVGKEFSFLYDLINNNINADMNRTTKPFCDISFKSNCVEYKEMTGVKSLYSIFEVNVQWLADDMTTVIRNNRFVKMFPEGVAFHDENKQIDYTEDPIDTKEQHLNRIIFHHSFVDNSGVCIIELTNYIWKNTLNNFNTDFDTIALYLFGLSLIEEDVYSLVSDESNTWNSYPAGPLNYSMTGEIKNTVKAYGYSSAPIATDGFDFKIETKHTERDRPIPDGYQTPDSIYRVFLGSVILITNIHEIDSSISPTHGNNNLLIPVYCPILPKENNNKLNRNDANETNRIYFTLNFLNMSNYNSIQSLTNYINSKYETALLGFEDITYLYTEPYPASVDYYQGTARFTPYDKEENFKDLYLINGNISTDNIDFTTTAMSIFLSGNINNAIDLNENHPELFFNSSKGIKKAWKIFTIINNISITVLGKVFKTAILTTINDDEDPISPSPLTLDAINVAHVADTTTTRDTTSLILTGIHKPSFNELINFNEISLFDNIAFFANNNVNNDEILSNYFRTTGRFVLDYNPSSDIFSDHFSFMLNTDEKLMKREALFGEINGELTVPNVLKSTYIDFISTNENFNDNTLCGIKQGSGFDNMKYIYPCKKLVGNKISCFIDKYIISENLEAFENNPDYLKLTNRINICCSNIVTRNTIEINQIKNSFNSANLIGFPESYITPYLLNYNIPGTDSFITDVFDEAEDKNNTIYSAKINSFYYHPSQVVQLKGLGVVYINVEIPIGIQRGGVYAIEGDFSGFFINSRIKPTCHVFISKTNASSSYTPMYDENAKDIGATLVEDCFIGDLNQSLKVGEDALTTAKGIKIKLKPLLLKCGMSLSKYIVVALSPVRVMGFSKGLIYSVHSYLNSVLLTFSKENAINIWQNFDDPPNNLTIFSNLCNLDSFSPNISGMKGVITFTFDTSNYFKDLNTSKALEEGPNEISIYFPFSIFENLKKNVLNDFILCFVNKKLHPCNVNDFNFVNIKFPEKLGYQNGEVYEVSVYGLTIPNVTSNEASNDALACSINFYNTFNGRRKNIIVGYGEIKAPIPLYSSSQLTSQTTATSDFLNNNLSNNLALKYIGALQIVKMIHEDNPNPREKTSLTFNVEFDKQFSLIPPFTMMGTPFYLHISFSNAFNVMIDRSKLIYPNEYYKIEVIVVERNSMKENDINEHFLSISEINLNSNTISLLITDKTIVFSKKFAYIKIFIDGIRYNDYETIDTGFFNIFLTDSTNKYVLRTITNINKQEYTGIISPPISEFLVKSRGWRVKYSNTKKSTVFVNMIGEPNSYNDYKFIYNKEEDFQNNDNKTYDFITKEDGSSSSNSQMINSNYHVNKIFIRSGRFSKQKFIVKNPLFNSYSSVDFNGSLTIVDQNYDPNNTNSNNSNNSINNNTNSNSNVNGGVNVEGYKESKLFLQDSVFRTLETSYKIYNKENFALEVHVGVPCGYMSGIYLPRFTLSNNVDFYPLPFIISEIIYDSTKANIFLHKNPLLEINEESINSNLLNSAIRLGKATSTFLFYSVLDPPVDDLIIGFEPFSSNNNSSYMEYSELKAKQSSNSVKFKMVNKSKLIQKYKPFSPNICFEIIPGDEVSFIFSSEENESIFTNITNAGLTRNLKFLEEENEDK